MNAEFWKALLIRTVKTWCQAFVGAIGGTATVLSDVNWSVALSGATLAAIICFFWNLGTGLPEVKLAETLYTLDNDPEEYAEEDEDEDEEGDE